MHQLEERREIARPVLVARDVARINLYVLERRRAARGQRLAEAVPVIHHAHAGRMPRDGGADPFARRVLVNNEALVAASRLVEGRAATPTVAISLIDQNRRMAWAGFRTLHPFSMIGGKAGGVKHAVSGVVVNGERRISLAQALGLLLALACALSTVVFALVTVVSLRHGFTAYLRARDNDMLISFAAIAERALERDPALLARPGKLDLRLLLDELALTHGITPPSYGMLGPGVAAWPGAPPPFPPPPGLAPPGFAGPPVGSAPPDGPGLAPPPGAPPPGGDDFPTRISLFTPDGQWLAGMQRRPPPDAASVPIHRGGAVAAFARLAPALVPAGIDDAFLASQYRAIALSAGLVLAVAVALGARAARMATQPITAVQAATHRIAHGDFAIRLPPVGLAEVAAMMADINHMAQALQRLERTRRQWLADISHELRTPLTVLSGEIEALEDGVHPLNAASVASLRGEIDALIALVADLHLLATADLGRLPCHMQMLDVQPLIKAAIARFANKAHAAGHVLTIHVDRPPGAACWDRRRIDQVLANLLSNALRYTDALGRIELALSHDDATVRVHIDDTAPAVTPDQLTRLAQPFYRADPGRSREAGGTGLGLAVAHAIAVAHGGGLGFAHSPLGGLSVTLTLPRMGPQHP